MPLLIACRWFFVETSLCLFLTELFNLPQIGSKGDYIFHLWTLFVVVRTCLYLIILWCNSLKRLCVYFRLSYLTCHISVKGDYIFQMETLFVIVRKYLYLSLCNSTQTHRSLATPENKQQINKIGRKGRLSERICK